MKRKALFVGVNRYEDPQIRDLSFSVRDANSLHDFFEEMGYETDILENPIKAEVFSAIRNLTADMKSGDLFLFYFAGHGWTTTAGRHLLFCREDIYENLRYDYNTGIPFDILKRCTESGGFNRAFVLDACRSDFMAGTRGDDTTTRDLRPMREVVGNVPSSGSLAVIRSCSKFEHALEIESRKHGLFTLAMIDVLRRSRNSGTKLLFGESLCDAVAEKMQTIAQEVGIRAQQTPEFAKAGVSKIYICGQESILPSRRQKSPSADDHVAEIKPEHPSRQNGVASGTAKRITLPGGVCMDMIYCAPGGFMMGSSDAEAERCYDESQHAVRLTKGFWLGRCPVTQDQWESVMGDNPSCFKGSARPVDHVSWNECQCFLEKLNAALGCKMRLPTEAEWEYACRAGGNAPYGAGGKLADMGWYCANSGFSTHPVGEKAPNAWGFHDMFGNVWEWCSDWYGEYPSASAVDPDGGSSGHVRVMRGGGWYDEARYCRASYRYGYDPSCNSACTGLRICCTELADGLGAESDKIKE